MGKDKKQNLNHFFTMRTTLEERIELRTFFKENKKLTPREVLIMYMKNERSL